MGHIGLMPQSVRGKFKYKGKFRIVPLNFGEYDGHKIFDYEEAGVGTKDLSFDDFDDDDDDRDREEHVENECKHPKWVQDTFLTNSTLA